MTAEMYSQIQIYNAAIAAYAEAACADPDYQRNKAESFVRRCVNSQNLETGSDIPGDLYRTVPEISRQAIKNVAYAALDASCEAALWRNL